MRTLSPTIALRLTALLLCALAAAAGVRAEQVETLTIMAGTPHQTSCFVKRGDTPGPTVFIIGGMHGDETAGYLAARKLKDWTITTGTLVLIPDSHITAIKANQRDYPANMNKQFPGNPRGTMMQRAAWEIWSLIKQHRPALLVTLHESVGLHRDNPRRFGQTLTYDFKELTPTFQPLLEPINRQLPNPRHHFLLKVYPLRGCPTDCAWRFLKIPALTVETTRTMKLEERVGQQLVVCAVLMSKWGLQWEGGKSAGPVTHGVTPADLARVPSPADRTIILASSVQEVGTAPAISAERAREHVTALASTIGPRPAGSAAEKRALDYCARQLQEMGYNPFRQTVPIWSGLTSGNVSTTLVGCGDEIVIGAHVDSVPWGPGANDNASGAAAVLELARYYRKHPPKQTITFALFGAEEGRYAKGKLIAGWGRRGSKHYVSKLSADRVKQMRLMINLDQVAGGPGLRVGDMSEKGHEPVKIALRLAKELGIPLTQTTFQGKSDYRFFHDRGIPIMSFDCGHDPLTHKAGDTPGKLRYGKMEQIMRVVVAYIARG
jgi:hypothetical protein